MTEQINNISKQIELTKDKVYQSNNIINILHFYTNINNNSSVLEMLEDVKKEVLLQEELIKETLL
jgi:division protein CdvB (Snf7/Vps24/ESCRT-III family)